MSRIKSLGNPHFSLMSMNGLKIDLLNEDTALYLEKNSNGENIIKV